MVWPNYNYPDAKPTDRLYNVGDRIIFHCEEWVVLSKHRTLITQFEEHRKCYLSRFLLGKRNELDTVEHSSTTLSNLFTKIGSCTIEEMLTSGIVLLQEEAQRRLVVTD